MRDRLRLPLRFDAGAMRADLLGLEQGAWIEHYVRQNYEGAWTVLPLRAPAGAEHPIATIYSDPSAECFVDTPLLARCPYFRHVLASFQCPLEAVRLMKLAPGSVVKPHCDHDLSAAYGKARLHVPVVTNSGVEFWLNDERVVMDEGECWYLDLSAMHSVANRGEADRVHLVLDTKINPWLEEQLKAADAPGIVPGTVRPAAASVQAPGWVPFKVRADADPPQVDWCYLGEERFTLPFFNDTIARCLRKSFTERSLQETSIETLVELQAARPGLRPTAFIFHGSRCGSTLLAQMAAALPHTIVISEAAPIDHVLRAHAPEDVRVVWLRAVLNALGQPRAEEKHLIVKLDAWHTLQASLVRQAFPGVPCVFLYREPSQVIASQLRMSGLQMVPGMLDPAIVGCDSAGVLQLDREEYCSRVLGAIYAAAAGEAAAGRVTLLNYAEFPDRASSQVLEWCTPANREEAVNRLHDVARFDAKTPSLFYDAANVSRGRLSERAIEMVARFVEPHYARLEEIRGRAVSLD